MIDVATLAAALALVKASGGGGSGEPGFSPTVEIAEVEGGTQVTITDVNGPQTFTVLNGTNGTNGVNGQDGQDGVSPVLRPPWRLEARPRLPWAGQRRTLH